MKATDWNAEAVKVADYITQKMLQAHRGVVPWHNQLVIAFGNDGFSKDNASQEVVAGLQAYLKDFPSVATELGFGLDTIEPGYSWAMILRAGEDCDNSETAALVLNTVLWGLWELGNGTSRTSRITGGMQRRIVDSLIIKELEAPEE
jgi:hypothetical protein